MKQKKLLWLAALVALLFAVYFLVAAATQKSEAAAETGVAVRTLTGDINQITATYGEGWTLEKQNDAWSWADDADFPLSRAAPSAMAAAIQTLTASTKVLDVVENIADYGLNAPQNVVRVQTDAGESVTLTFGDTNAHTGETYLMVSDDTALYTVDAAFVTKFSYDLYDMISLESWPVVTASAIQSAVLTTADGTLQINVAQADDDAKTYTLTAGGASVSADATAVVEWLSAIANLSFSGCMDYKADEATRAECGLTEPAAVLTVEYTEGDAAKSITLYVGNGSEDGMYFTQTKDSTAINMAPGSSVAPVVQATASTLTGAATAQETESAS